MFLTNTHQACPPVSLSRSPVTCRIAWLRSKSRSRKRSHPHLQFTTAKEKVTPIQVQELWSCTDYRHSCEERVALALEHTFAVAAAFSTEPPTGTNSAGTATPPRLVGFARAISDGAFAALIIDVVVHADCRRQGIGRKLMALLVRDCLSRGATGCLVFAPRERLFFWKCGFRLGSRYKVMGITALDEQ